MGPLLCCWEWLPIPRMVPVQSPFLFPPRRRISSAPPKAPQPTPTLLLLLVVVIPRLLCYVHPKSALVRRRSWHRKMKIASTSSAWMVRPNPRKNKTKREVYIGAAYGAVAGGGDTTSSLLRTSAVSTSTSKVMAQEDEDSFNIVSNMDGSSKSTQKPNKRKGATLEVFSLLRTSDVSTSTSKVMAQEDFYQKETKGGYWPDLG